MVEVNEMEKLPEGWKKVKLGEVGEFKTSSVDKKIREEELPVKLVNYMDVYKRNFITKSLKLMEVTANKHQLRTNRVVKGDVLFTPTSETPDDIGHSAVVLDDLKDTLYSYHLVRLRFKNNGLLDIKFKGYVFNSRKILHQFEILSTGVTRYTLSKKDFEELFIYFPKSKSEQSKIAESLETVDNAIEKTDRIIEKHKRIKQGLMQDLLTKGIDENGQIRSEETHRFKDSPLGRMPEEWEMVEFYNLFDVIDNRGRTPLFSEEGTIPYLSAENIKNGKILYDFGNFVTDKTYKRYMRGIPTQDHILFTTEAPLGEVAPLPEIKFCFAQRVIAMKPKKGCSKYYLFLIQYELIQRQLNNFVSGTTVKGISAKNLKKVNFIAPPLPEQHRIASILSQIDETIEKEQKYKEKLGRIKQGLMEDLLTGKIRVNHLIDEGVENVSQT